MNASVALVTLLLAAAPAAAQAPPDRPIPAAADPSADFERAVRRGTRTTTGQPGPRYWQQFADYRISARVDVEARRLEGTAEIRYHNRSPDTLAVLWLQLAQNFHAPGAIRYEEAEVTGGFELQRVSAFGTRLGPGRRGPRYAVDGTSLAIHLPRPLLPGESAALAIDWAFTVPQAGAGGRMGHDAGDLFYLAYWYPQMAVYDDVVGWQTDPFTGPAEFYAGFANYDLTVDAPAGWIVHATGALQNAAEALAPDVLARLRLAESADTVVAVVREPDFGRATRATSGRVSWHFRADSVRDVAFSLTRASRWDARRTAIGDRDGDGDADFARVHAVYRPAARFWRNAARYGAHALDFLSRFTGMPYRYPHMTAVEGGEIIGGGMEYPMMTLIGHYNQRGDSALYWVIAHEFAHMWVPMMVGSDERRFGWLDEGMTTFAENQSRKEFFPGINHDVPDRAGYLDFARTGEEGEMMRRTDFHYSGAARQIATYQKPATVLVALRGLLGDSVFMQAYREFHDRWAFRHPYPWDLWNTFESVSGRDLDWFWRSWYYETWVLDQAVREVRTADDGVHIVIEDRGRVPMPVRLLVTRAGGATSAHELPVDAWLKGVRTATAVVPRGAEVVRVEIDPAHDFPDVNRANNIWRR